MTGRRDRTRAARRGALTEWAPWVISTLAVMVAALAAWIRYQFGAVTFDQIVTNLPVVDGGDLGSTTLFVRAAMVAVVVPVLTVILIARLRRRKAAPRARPGRRWPRLVIPPLALAVSIGVLVSVSGLPAYLKAVLADRTMAGYYVRPAVAGNPVHPRNLITIYLESVEQAFGNEAIFGQNLLAELDAATEGWTDYQGLQQYPGGGWTMAGFVSTQCGLPLKGPSLTLGQSPNRLGQQVERYLPGADCLGDVLLAHGYVNAFVGGANLGFAGKGLYLRDHGYTIVKGLEDWKAGDEDASGLGLWGLSDARMLGHARETLRELRASGSPFNLTLLTLDTHDPPGVFDSCRTDDVTPETTALRCSMRAVAGFLADLEAGGYLEDTVVMVMTDHRRIIGEFDVYGGLLGAAGDRPLILRVSSPDQARFSRPGADQFSVLASTLELLGFAVPDGRAGIGVSFVRPHDLSGTAVALPADDYRELVESPSRELYTRLWQG